VCPFIEASDPRCAAHWTLHNLAEAYRHCADDYRDCPVYKQLTRELLRHGLRGADRAAVLAAS
jgi:hypothetical protein